MSTEQHQEVASSLQTGFDSGMLIEYIAHHSNELVSVCDQTGRFVYASPSYGRVLGFTPAMFVDRSVFDFVHPDDQDAKRHAWQTISAEQPRQMSFRQQHTDSSWHWLEANIILTIRNSVRYIVSIAHDITHHKQAEQERDQLLALVKVAQVESEAMRSELIEQKQVQITQRKLTALVQNSADLIAIVSLNGELQFLNAAGMRLLGIDSQVALSSISITETLEHADGDLLMDHVLPAVMQHGNWFGEVHSRNLQTGERIPLLANIFLLTDQPTGQPIGYATVSRDIRERRNAEQRQQLLIDASAALGKSLDYENTLAGFTQVTTHWFAQWCALVGIESDDTVRILAANHAQAEQTGELVRLLKQPPGSTFKTETDALRDGRAILLQDVAALIPNAPESWQQLCALGGPSMIIIPLKLNDHQVGTLSFASPFGRHYTEDDQQVAEELGRRAVLAIENTRLYRNSQQAIGVRDQFLSIASHELKTPLTSILGSLQLLQRRTVRENTLNERDSHTLQAVIDQTLRFNRLITGLLDLSRLQRNQFEVEHTPLDLELLVDQVVSDMQLITEQHTVVYEPPAQRVEILGDTMRLEQVLQNLIQNAVKYSPGGGEIHVSLQRTQQQAVIIVEDRGLGIPQESLPFLFDRFYRAPNVKAQNLSGIGIGLFVVREIVQFHGGTVSAENADSQGSIFTVRLPLAGN